MLDRDDYLDGLSGFQELDDADDAMLDDEDRQAEEAIAAWLHSRAAAAEADRAASSAEAGAKDSMGGSGPVTIRFDATTAVDGDLYMDCLTMFLLTQLDFELEAQRTAPGDREVALPDDRWQAEGEGMVPESFPQRLMRAQWKAHRQWQVDLDLTSTMEDYETQSRWFFQALAECGVCRITEVGTYENPFEGMTPQDLGDFPDDPDDDCPF